MRERCPPVRSSKPYGKTGTAAHAVDPNHNTGFEEDRHEHTEEEMKQAATYANWKDANGNAVVATEGGVGTPVAHLRGTYDALAHGSDEGHEAPCESL